jgi:hypothetical protein
MSNGEEISPSKLQALQKKMQTRFTLTRLAREAARSNDFITAIKNYNGYLRILAEVHNVDPFELNPSMFDPQKDLSELLLIAQVYWELIKIYDKTPKLQEEFQKALNQFVVFTINQQFQIVNAEMLRKYMKTSRSANMNELQKAYDKIFIESDKCFIASMCFGADHDITHQLRQFKPWLVSFSVGKNITGIYYHCSPKLVQFCREHPLFAKIFINFSKPLLISLAYLSAKFKLN